MYFNIVAVNIQYSESYYAPLLRTGCQKFGTEKQLDVELTSLATILVVRADLVNISSDLLL